MATKRNRKNRKSKNGPGFEEVAGLAKGTRFIDQDLIDLSSRLGIRIQKALFGPGGFRCVRCGYSTAKRGTAGRNSLRGHHKGHLFEDNAGKTMKRSILMVAVSMVAILLWSFLWESLEIIASDFFTKLEPSTLIGAGYAISSILILIAVTIAASRLLDKYSRNARLVFLVSLALTLALASLAMIMVSGQSNVAVDPLWFLFGFLPLMMAAFVARPIGLKHLQYRRRKLPPANYISRYKALTEAGDDIVDDMEIKIKRLIRTKKLTVDMLDHREKLALISLGIRMQGLATELPVTRR
jgi:hypothetical protein